MEEMAAEEGFPAYLPQRIAEFYERAGYMATLAEARARSPSSGPSLLREEISQNR
jgi:V/A-type H+-transporting ATPase subunit A